MPDHYFWLDGIRSDDMGIYLQSPIEFSSAVRRVETISITGRSGDLHISDGSFENVTGTATCYLLERYVGHALDRLGTFLGLESGYRRLETSYEPDIYRMARITGAPGSAVRMGLLNPFTIEFDCMPQKFLLSGEYPIIVTKTQHIHNDYMPAAPLIRVYGDSAGSIAVNGVTIQIQDIDGYMDIDCGIQNAYKESENMNASINAPSFPVFNHGDNTVGFSGGITQLQITPRWWTL